MKEIYITTSQYGILRVRKEILGIAFAEDSRGKEYWMVLDRLRQGIEAGKNNIVESFGPEFELDT